MPPNPAARAKITITQGDTAPPLRARLRGAAGLAQGLLGARVFLTIVRENGSAPIVADREITIEDAANGIVRYNWQAGDTATPGSYVARFRVLLGDGRQMSFPNGWTFIVRILPAL